MNTRLKQFLAAENISQAQFADNINVVRASVSHVLSGRNNPSFDFIKAMMHKYPRLNIEWLIFGKGKMYKDTPVTEPEPKPGELFFDDLEPMTEKAPRIADSLPFVNEITNELPTNAIENSINTTQVAANQRKVSKIIILFDDGSFQEM